MTGIVEGIFVAPRAGERMRRVADAEALTGLGFEGDRYAEGAGHWSRFGRRCEVTLIAAEDLDRIEAEAGVSIGDGEHRRNLVIRGVDLKALRRKSFRVGETILAYESPCSVCRHVERLTEPGMTQALKGRGGICARVVSGGRIRAQDAIVLL